MREDAITLYGFPETAERDWFRLLTTVQGVGARVALAILVDAGARRARPRDRGAGQGDAGRAPGVGPKLAARLASELKDKAGGLRRDAGAGRHRARRRRQRRRRVDQRGCGLGSGQSRLRARRGLSARWPRWRAAGRRAPLDALIRAGLKELAR